MSDAPPAVKLTEAQRKKLMVVMLDTSSFDQRQWSHFLLLSAEGRSPTQIAEATHSEVSEIEACLKCFGELGLDRTLESLRASDR